MPIELERAQHEQALLSIQRYFATHLAEHMAEPARPLGNIAARGLLNFVLHEIGPSIYNQAVRDVQERLARRVEEVDLEVHHDEFTYWPVQAKSLQKR
jgi:uncharacterized protein (DUF2164 family)